MPDMVLPLQGQNKVLTARIHALAGLLPEPVRQYCTNINRIIMAQEPTTNPLPLLRGLYPDALPEELASVAPGLVGSHLPPEALKMQLAELILEQVFTGQELRHRKWSEVRFSCPVTGATTEVGSIQFCAVNWPMLHQYVWVEYMCVVNANS